MTQDKSSKADVVVDAKSTIEPTKPTKAAATVQPREEGRERKRPREKTPSPSVPIAETFEKDDSRTRTTEPRAAVALPAAKVGGYNAWHLIGVATLAVVASVITTWCSAGMIAERTVEQASKHNIEAFKSAVSEAAATTPARYAASSEAADTMYFDGYQMLPVTRELIDRVVKNRPNSTGTPERYCSDWLDDDPVDCGTNPVDGKGNDGELECFDVTPCLVKIPATAKP